MELPILLQRIKQLYPDIDLDKLQIGDNSQNPTTGYCTDGMSVGYYKNGRSHGMHFDFVSKSYTRWRNGVAHGKNFMNERDKPLYGFYFNDRKYGQEVDYIPAINLQSAFLSMFSGASFLSGGTNLFGGTSLLGGIRE